MVQLLASSSAGVMVDGGGIKMSRTLRRGWVLDKSQVRGSEEWRKSWTKKLAGVPIKTKFLRSYRRFNGLLKPDYESDSRGNTLRDNNRMRRQADKAAIREGLKENDY